jgi:DNA replication protein DnaC
MTFETFDVRGNSPGDQQRASLEHACKFASNYAEQPDGWVTFFGETGVGKTHLAVAIAAQQLDAGYPVFFIMVADLLDHLRATFAPNSLVTYDQRFEEIKNSPLLVLDDLGKERGSTWAEEKLHQLIVHRHNARLPTVITTLVDFTRPEEQGPIGSRIQDPSVGELIRLDAPDYRNKRQRPPPRRRRPVAKGKATR